jgi:hypothetical protein
MIAKTTSFHWSGSGLAVCVLLAGLVAGCGNDKETKPPDQLAPPTNLRYVNGNNQVAIGWDASPDAQFSVGYNVYRHTASIVNLSPGDLEQYKINTSLVDRETNDYTDDTAENGTMYFYHVRAVEENGDLSDPSNEIDTAPRPDGGIVTLAEFTNQRPSGLNLSRGVAVSMMSENADSIDVYLGTTGPNDEPDQELALKSPSLVSDQPPWNTRLAQLKLLDSWDVSTTSSSGWSDNIPLGTSTEEIENKIIAIRTPSQNGHVFYGKIRIIANSGSQGNRDIGLLWAFQPIPDYLRF